MHRLFASFNTAKAGDPGARKPCEPRPSPDLRRTLPRLDQATEPTNSGNSFRPAWKSTLTPGDTSKLFSGTVDVADGWWVPRADIGALAAATNANISSWI